MATKKFAFRYGDPKRITVRTQEFNRKAVVSLDGVQLGKVEKLQGAGKTFTLADGSQLTIRHHGSGRSKGLHVSHSGHLLPGSAGTDAWIVEQGAGAAFFVAGATLIFSILSMTGVIPFTFEWWALPLGGLIGWLGYQMKTVHSFPAAAITATAVALSTLYGIVSAIQLGANPLSGLIPRAIVLYLLIRAVPAANRILKNHRSSYSKALENA